MYADLTCFKSYDIRGDLNTNFDATICYRIARAFAIFLKANKVVVGRDARESSPLLMDSICNGLINEGVKVLDIGLSGTEEMYWATTQYEASGGIQITASPFRHFFVVIVKARRSNQTVHHFPRNPFQIGVFSQKFRFPICSEYVNKVPLSRISFFEA